jgi:hypothetical protein
VYAFCLEEKAESLMDEIDALSVKEAATNAGLIGDDAYVST